MSKRTTFRLLAGAAMLLLAPLAHAQYVWVDAKGVKQFSDRAPPGSVPLKSILKSPTRLQEPVQAEAAIGVTASVAKAAPATSWVDREADYRKRQTEKAKADGKLAQTAANDAQRQAACDSARGAKAQLASGVRLRNADRSFVGDAQRNEQAALVNDILSECN